MGNPHDPHPHRDPVIYVPSATSAPAGRPDWDDYFLAIAGVVSSRATCARKHVGAVVVSAEHQILSTGYNGSPPGAPHCDDADHELIDGHCVRTVHAEANAVAQAAKNGVPLAGATVYTTASPCYDCAKLVVNAGIKRVVFGEQYDSRYGMSDNVAEFLLKCGIAIKGWKLSWRPDGRPTEVESAVGAERLRAVAAVREVLREYKPFAHISSGVLGSLTSVDEHVEEIASKVHETLLRDP